MSVVCDTEPFQKQSHSAAGALLTNVRAAEASDTAFLLLIIALALALRLDFLIASNFGIEADEAIVGLMGTHILNGGEFPVFYYGQHYMGSLEAILTAGVFKVFGVSHAALKIVPLLFSLGVTWLVYHLGRSLGGRNTGRIAAILCALAPSQYIVWSLKARGGFIELVFIGALALLLTVQNLTLARPLHMRTFIIGTLVGVGWWVNNQIIYFVVPIGAAYLCFFHMKRGERGNSRTFAAHLSLGLAAFFIGSLPFWTYNFANDFVSFDLFARPRLLSVNQQVSALFETALPILIGAKRLWHDNEVFPFSTYIAFAAYTLLFIVVLWSRRSYISAFPAGRLDFHAPIELLILMLLSGLMIFSISSFGHLAAEPRYLLPINVALFVLAAYGISEVLKSSRIYGLILISIILGLNIASLYYGGRAIPGEPFVYEGQRVSRDHSELIGWLRKRNLHWVRTNYWIGYRLAFETGESIKFLLFREPYETRIAAYREEGRKFSWEDLPFVLVPRQARRIENALKSMGYNYEKETVSGYRVIHNISAPRGLVAANVSEAGAAYSSYATSDSALALDGDSSTRWGSGTRQKPGMLFEIVFDEPLKIRAIRYDLGKWIHDYPRGLAIDLITKRGRKKHILDPRNYGDIRYLLENEPAFTIHFKPVTVKKVKLTQTKAHSVFDWSIAELGVFE